MKLQSPWEIYLNLQGKVMKTRFKIEQFSIHTCASWILIEFPLALASDSFPFQTLLSPLYSYLLSRKLKTAKQINTVSCKTNQFNKLFFQVSALDFNYPLTS